MVVFVRECEASSCSNPFTFPLTGCLEVLLILRKMLMHTFLQSSWAPTFRFQLVEVVCQLLDIKTSFWEASHALPCRTQTEAGVPSHPSFVLSLYLFDSYCQTLPSATCERLSSSIVSYWAAKTCLRTCRKLFAESLHELLVFQIFLCAACAILRQTSNEKEKR